MTSSSVRRSSCTLLLVLASCAHAERDTRDSRDERDERTGETSEGRQVNVLAVLPGTASQATGSLPGVTVTRASVRGCARDDGTYAVLTANQPCVEAQGLLVEQGVTNFAVVSGPLSGVGWGSSTNSTAITATVNALTSPLGTQTATLLNFPVPIPPAGWSRWATSLSGTNVAGTYQWGLWVSTGGGTATTAPLSAFATVNPAFVNCPLSASWTRCSVTISGHTSAGTITPLIGSNGASWTAGSMGVWGGQVEKSEYLHAYVPTTTSASSADDVVTVPSLSPGVSRAFCLGATFKPTLGRTWQSRSGTIALWQLGTSGGDDSISVSRDSSSKVVVVLQDAEGGTKTFTSSGTLTGSSAKRVTYCHTPGTGGSLYLDGAADGGSWTGDGSGVVVQASAFTLGRLGSASGTMLDGHVSNLCISSRASLGCF